jgi:hypothetical protein
MTNGSSAAEDRVWRALPAEAREPLERGLAPTDLQTLLLSVARARAERVTPHRLLARWREDRFVRPSRVDPRLLARVEPVLWAALPTRFAGVELSPLAPLGCCAALGPVHQNRVVTTARGSEVVSDPTNALAVEAAARRSTGARGPVHLAACCRVVRAQAFDGPGLSAHFRLFALVSTGRDTGAGRTESAMLVEHLGYWHDVLVRLRVREAVTLSVTPFGGGVLAERLTDEVLPTLAARGVAVRLDSDRTHGAGYYDGGVALSIDAAGPEGQLGDGGATTWTAQLLGDRKERCLASCISTERLAARVAAL